MCSRLGLLCALAALAGCEQTYSSSPQTESTTMQAAGSVTGAEPAADQPAGATAEKSEANAPAAEQSPAESKSPADSQPADPKPADSQPAVSTQATPKPAAAKAKQGTAKQGTADLTFDDIKFDIEKDGMFERSMLTPEIEALVGQTVRIRGYILPTFQQTGIRNFVLVRDNLECCFGPGAALYDCIVVDMVAGQSTDFTTRPVAVEGTFDIRELLDFDGVVRAIYHLEGKAVK
jgi:hypothetical protein